jgi:UDPglucose 6-dehydrogenase
VYKIGIIGRGHVGQTVIRQLSDHHEVVSYDRLDSAPYPSEQLSQCDFAMICVDTPSREDGSVNVGNVEAAVAQLPTEHVLIRSTVPPGTTERLAASTGKSICFWPEYVGETTFLGSAWDRFAATEPFIILGGEPDVRRRFADLLLPIYGPETRIFQSTAAEAELVKYMENSYFAAKIIFVNEFRDLAETLGLDWHTVREGWLLDPRVERDHTVAFDSPKGFSGKCLPKDLAGILDVAETAGSPLRMLSAVQDVNRGYLAAAAE